MSVSSGDTEQQEQFSNRDLARMIVPLFGTYQIAANGVAQSIWSLAALAGAAFGPVLVTVIGQCMGAHDVAYTMWVSIGCTLGVRLTLSYLLGVVLDMGVMGIAWAMCADWLARGILLTLRWRGGASASHSVRAFSLSCGSS